MPIKLMFFLFVAFTLGYATSSGYAGDTNSCDSTGTCPDGDVRISSALLDLESRVDALETENAALKTLLGGVSRVTDSETSQDTLRFTNMNLQIVSGSGATDGLITGTGNLIIGYNELKGNGDERSGSHMLVIGRYNKYSSYGGMVIGTDNSVLAEWASVSGGSGNTASGSAASVSGGYYNTASGFQSSVSGGSNNSASGSQSSVNGGSYNRASSSQSSVSGGLNRFASTTSCIVGDDQVNC